MVLGIYGSGGLGREIFGIAKQINTIGQRWTELIFIDDFRREGPPSKDRVIAFAEARAEFTLGMLEICIAVGEPSVRAELYERVYGAGYGFASLIHPQARVPDGATIGSGTVICSGCFVSCGVELGVNVLLQPTSSVGHDCKIGPHSVISTFVSLAGHCTIGARTFIGMNVPVKEDTLIGDDVIIGMGSVVLRNIEDGMIALGNPARPMSTNAGRRVFRK